MIYNAIWTEFFFVITRVKQRTNIVKYIGHESNWYMAINLHIET